MKRNEEKNYAFFNVLNSQKSHIGLKKLTFKLNTRNLDKVKVAGV